VRQCQVRVGVRGFEPRTSALSELRSNQLSYTPWTSADRQTAGPKHQKASAITRTLKAITCQWGSQYIAPHKFVNWPRQLQTKKLKNGLSACQTSIKTRSPRRRLPLRNNPKTQNSSPRFTAPPPGSHRPPSHALKQPPNRLLSIFRQTSFVFTVRAPIMHCRP
jgi:hypothetical protein